MCKKMDELTTIVDKERRDPETKEDCPTYAGKEIKVYSQKVGANISVSLGNVKGEIQKYNIGLGPGNWY